MAKYFDRVIKNIGLAVPATHPLSWRPSHEQRLDHTANSIVRSSALPENPASLDIAVETFTDFSEQMSTTSRTSPNRERQPLEPTVRPASPPAESTPIVTPPESASPLNVSPPRLQTNQYLLGNRQPALFQPAAELTEPNFMRNELPSQAQPYSAAETVSPQPSVSRDQETIMDSDIRPSRPAMKETKDTLSLNESPKAEKTSSDQWPTMTNQPTNSSTSEFSPQERLVRNQRQAQLVEHYIRELQVWVAEENEDNQPAPISTASVQRDVTVNSPRGQEYQIMPGIKPHTQLRQPETETTGMPEFTLSIGSINVTVENEQPAVKTISRPIPPKPKPTIDDSFMRWHRHYLRMR